MIPDLIKSRRLAKELLAAKFETKQYDSKRPLVHILSGTKNDSVKLSLFDYENAVNNLSESIKIARPVRTSGLLLITVSAYEPKLAMDIVNEIIFRLKELTNSFRLNRLQQKESFIRNRLNTVKNDFIDANRRAIVLFDTGFFISFLSISDSRNPRIDSRFTLSNPEIFLGKKTKNLDKSFLYAFIV